MTGIYEYPINGTNPYNYKYGTCKYVICEDETGTQKEAYAQI